MQMRLSATLLHIEQSLRKKLPKMKAKISIGGEPLGLPSLPSLTDRRTTLTPANSVIEGDQTEQSML